MVTKDCNESYISKEKLDLSIEYLECSPVKLIGQMNRVGYRKRKLAQIGNAAQVKMANELGLDAKTLQDTVGASTPCCQRKQDLEALMKLIKTKYCHSSASENSNLLALAPDSWTTEVTHVYLSKSQISVK